MNLEVRPATADDVPAMTTLYAHYVLNSVATFDEQPPREDEINAMRHAIGEQELPYYVCMHNQVLAGYAYAAPFRARAAYRFTVEDTIYIHPDHHRLGIGRALLQVILRKSAEAGKREMIAVIGGSDNTGSIGLHASMGFSHVGVLVRAGFKFNRWIDVVLMQRSLP